MPAIIPDLELPLDDDQVTLVASAAGQPQGRIDNAPAVELHAVKLTPGGPQTS